MKREKTIVATFERLRTYGGNVLQIFVCNPRSGRITPQSFQKYIDEAVATNLKQYLKTNDLQLWIHSPYTLNIAKPFSPTAYWITTILQQLAIADAIGAEGVITHVGHGAAPSDIDEMRKAISYILREWRGRAKFVLETASGMGTELLADLRQLRDFVKEFSSSRLKICIDTAHVWAMGYDPIDALRIVGKKYIACVHLNRNPRPLRSRVDRHECGLVADARFAVVVDQCAEWRVPMIMETPRECWKKEIILLRKNRDRRA